MTDQVSESSWMLSNVVLLQVLERQKLWQKQWREKVEREGTLYDAIAVVDDIIIGR